MSLGTEFHPFIGMGGVQLGLSPGANVSRLQFYFCVGTVPFYNVVTKKNTLFLILNSLFIKIVLILWCILALYGFGAETY